MSMNGNTLGTEIWTAIQAGNLSSEVAWQTAMTKLIAHIKANAVITIDTASVTTGAGAGGTVTGTAKVTS